MVTHESVYYPNPFTSPTYSCTTPSHLSAANAVKTEGIEKPQIAVPSDLYQDFEALKSATNLDTSTLMRKLLSDFQRLSNATNQQTEKRLSNVIDCLLEKNNAVLASSALDLSKPKTKITKPNKTMPSSSSLFDTFISSNQESVPLDLSINKQEVPMSPDSAIVEDLQDKNSLSNMKPPSDFQKASSSSSDHIDPYIVNLESYPEQSSSIDTLKDSLNREMFKFLQERTAINEKSTLVNHSNARNPFSVLTSVLTLPSVQKSTIPQNSSQMPDTSTSFSDISTRQPTLPSYSEATAINSKLFPSPTVMQKLLMAGGVNDINTKNVTNNTEESSGRYSYLQISPDSCDIRVIPVSVPATLIMAGSLPLREDNIHLISDKTDNLKKHVINDLMLSQASSHFSSCGQKINENSPKIVEGSTFHSNVFPAVTYPNFLLDHPTHLTSSSESIRHSETTKVVSSNFPSSSISSTSSLHNMMAIPLIHTTKDNFQEISGISFTQQISNTKSDPIDLISNSSTSLTNYTDSTKTLRSISSQQTKLKPGRPKGRGGKHCNSKSAQNKDMKLVTENTLFPGVYTSILKLPWSKRARSKNKTKNIVERKPESALVEPCAKDLSEKSINLEAEPPKKYLKLSDSVSNSAVSDSVSVTGSGIACEHPQLYSKLLQKSLLHRTTPTDVDMLVQRSKEHMPIEDLKTDEFKPKESIERVCPSFEHSSSDLISSNQQPKTKGDKITSMFMMYENIGPNLTVRTGRRRGRPPKFVSTQNTKQESDGPQNMFNENQNVPLLSAITVSNNNVTTEGTTRTEEENSNLKDSETFENRISFLTNKIGTEVNRNIEINEEDKKVLTLDEKSFSSETEMSQEFLLSDNNSLVDIKPRKKKTSRILKSDNNFMYATFRFKPKIQTPGPKRGRRKKRDILASTAAAAETIANLKQKRLHTTASKKQSKQNVSWKFHQQYTDHMDVKDTEVIADNEMIDQHFDQRNNINQNLSPNIIENVLSKQSSSAISEDIQTIVCITCGKAFQKVYSDPSSVCEKCQKNSTTIINSKLFTLQTVSPTLQLTTKPSTGTTPFVPKERRLNYDSIPCKIKKNNLFCGLCRMEFAKVCDYLTHIKDTHDVVRGYSPTLSNYKQNDPNKPKLYKTKKSLSHKTLMCPVEDCPHFFREHKDLEAHFSKVHSDSSLNKPNDISVVDTPNLVELNQCDEIVKPKSLEKPLLCPFCDYRCRQKNALSWHMRKHPEATQQPRKLI